MSLFFNKLLEPFLSDNDIVEAIQQWDLNKFEILYKRYYKKIHSYVITLLNYNNDEANLIMNEVFMQVYSYIIKNKVENVNAIFYKIAHNVVYQFIQKNQKTLIYNTDNYIGYIDSNQNIIDNIDVLMKQELLEYALSQLNDDEFFIMYAFFKENLSYKEIEENYIFNAKKIGNIVFWTKKKIKDIIFNSNWYSPKNFETKNITNDNIERFEKLKFSYARSFS